MKRIDVNNCSNDNNHRPWYMPWGKGGVAWRYLLFLALLVGFCLLLALLKGCDGTDHYDEIYEVPDWDAEQFDDPYLRDIINSPDGDNPFDGNIVGAVPELPLVEDNGFVDVPEDRIVQNPENPYRRISDSQLDIILNDNATDDTYNQFAQKFKALYPADDCYINYYNNMSGLIQITVPADKLEYIHDNLNSQIPEIDFRVIYDEIFSVSQTKPNDPAFKDKDQSWYFAPIQAYDAWEITKGNPDVVVAIIDNYIDVTHPELAGRITNPYSVERRSKNVLPPAGQSYSFDDPGLLFHGTHVAATAVGAIDNQQGTAGIAPKCTLMPISIGSQITSMRILDALLYAIKQGADVVNLSLGNIYDESITGVDPEEQLRMAETEGKYVQDVWDYVFKLADERNCTIVWAGGNQGIISGLDEYKRNPNTLRVSAVDHDLRRPDFSNYGRYESKDINYSDVSAPGVDIYNAGPGNQYGFSNGTSMAAPIVTGAVALLKSVNPSLTNAEIVEIISSTSKKLPQSDHAGGLLQIRDALERVTGDVANFDEIKDDKSKIVGNWETTELLDVTYMGRPSDFHTHIFLHFDTPQSGTITYREDTGNNYTAPFKATIDNDRIVIEQLGVAKSKTSTDYYEEVKFVGRRGANGMLECQREGGDPFYLIRRG